MTYIRERDKKIIESYKTKSQQQIADEVGLSRARIGKILQANGVQGSKLKDKHCKLCHKKYQAIADSKYDVCRKCYRDCLRKVICIKCTGKIKVPTLCDGCDGTELEDETGIYQSPQEAQSIYA